MFAMDLSERKRQILKAIIEQYIATAEPVGSKLLAAVTGGAVSSATIRNEMSELEEMGYIEKPHTSAGRAPTPLGYRLYVDELMSRCYATALEIEQIRRQLEEWRCAVQEILDRETFGHRRLLRAFPRLHSLDHASALERLHRRMENLRNH